MVTPEKVEPRRAEAALCIRVPSTATWMRMAARRSTVLLPLLLLTVIGLLVVVVPTLRRTREFVPVARFDGACPSAQEYLTPAISRTPQGIPKILHQVYKDFALPHQYRPLVQRCSELNKDFLHILWTDEDFQMFMLQKRPEWMNIFKKYTLGIQKSDVMRLMLLEHFGGVYIDLDVECRRSLSSYLEAHNSSCIFDREPELQTQLLHQRTALLMNSVVMAVPHHPFVIYLIEKLGISLWENFVLQRTGPLFITDRYLEFRRTNPASAETIFHAPSAHFSPVMDPSAMSDFNWFCRRPGKLKFHPLVISGCHQWKKEQTKLRSEEYKRNAVDKAYLVHRFLHLGYMKSSDAQYLERYSVCDEVPTVTRYGIVNLNEPSPSP